MDMKTSPTNRENAEAATARPASDVPALTPPVDVFEDENGITLLADLPGVSKENLNIRVEGEQLAIEGTVSLGESTRLEAVYAEVRVAQYRRTFALSGDLDTERIDAKMKNGVLTLRIPKAEQAKPRRIPVTVA
ncbi:MAG TPA: Hsp20/alpha crystallin family protein [Usitatibacter sp.]|nr:Hsp20/alpha crystallin family protein [Usitatibacter sp.]